MSTKKATLLFVDDEEKVLATLKRLLMRKQEEWAMIYISEAEKALEIIKTQLIDLVVTDLRMPKINGLELAQSVRKNSPNTKILILTAYAGVLPENIMDMIDGIITKPFNPPELVESLEQHVH